MSMVPGRIGGSVCVEGIKYVLSIIKEGDVKKDYLIDRINDHNEERARNGKTKFSCYDDRTDLISFIRLKVPLIERKKEDGQFIYNLTDLGRELTDYLYNDPQFKVRLFKELLKYSKTNFTYFDSVLLNIFIEYKSTKKIKKKELKRILNESCNGNLNAIRGCKGLLEGVGFLIDNGKEYTINSSLLKEMDEEGVLIDMLVVLKDEVISKSGEEWTEKETLVKVAKSQLKLPASEVNELVEKIIESGKITKKPGSRWDRGKIYVK